MAKYTGNSLTNLGKDLLARAIVSGEIITFTKVELGKGTAIENNEELEGLVDTFKILPITSTSKLEGGTYRVRVAFDNTGITEDKELREIGVFARGEDGEELLYSYCHTDTPDLIPAEGSGVVERVEDVITFIANAANVNAVIDQSKVYATVKDLIEGLGGKEDKFDKNSGFNLDKTDSAETDSSILVATAKAVKKAWDKAKEAIVFTDTNRAAILNNTEQIENLTAIESLGRTRIGVNGAGDEELFVNVKRIGFMLIYNFDGSLNEVNTGILPVLIPLNFRPKYEVNCVVADSGTGFSGELLIKPNGEVSYDLRGENNKNTYTGSCTAISNKF